MFLTLNIWPTWHLARMNHNYSAQLCGSYEIYKQWSNTTVSAMGRKKKKKKPKCHIFVLVSKMYCFSWWPMYSLISSVWARTVNLKYIEKESKQHQVISTRKRLLLKIQTTGNQNKLLKRVIWVDFLSIWFKITK